MSIEFTLPPLPNTTEVTVGRWQKQPGEELRAQEKLLEVHSEQFDWDIPAPDGGTLEAIVAQPGEGVKAGDVLARISNQSPVASRQSTDAGCETNADSAQSAESVPSALRITPIAARIASEHGIDLSQVQGTGTGGRVTKDDVLERVGHAPPATSPLHSTPDGDRAAVQDTLREPTPEQRARAERVSRSKQTIPHVTSFIQVDMSRVRSQIAAQQPAWQKREGFALDELPFIVQASAAALRAVPSVNSAFAASGIAVKRNYDIGIVGAQHAAPLHTSVIAHADTYNLVGIARRARSAQKDANPTFTIDTRGATTGALLYTGVVAEGQAATLGVGAIQAGAAVADDRLVIRPLCYLCLTYDHRVVDGIVAGQFLSEVKRMLEREKGLDGGS